MKSWIIDKLTGFKANLARAHRSLTIWFNGVVLALAGAMPFLADNLPQLKDYMAEGNYKAMMFIVVAGNIALRFKTNKALAQK